MASPMPNPTIPCSDRGVLNTLSEPGRGGRGGREWEGVRKEGRERGRKGGNW